MKNALKYIIITLVVALLYYVVYSLNYTLKYGVTPRQMKNVVANEVYQDWLKVMKQYLWAEKPTVEQIEGATQEQQEWINALKIRTGNIFSENKELYNEPKYVAEVENNLRYVAKQTGLSILSKDNIKPRVKVVLDSFGIDYTDPKSQAEFNRKFERFTKSL